MSRMCHNVVIRSKRCGVFLLRALLFVLLPAGFAQPDPCHPEHHRVLDDYRRQTSYVTQPRGTYLCDAYLETAWYRFLVNGTHASVPTSCVQPNRCGTQAPVWLNIKKTQIPSPGEEVTTQACSSWSSPGQENNCCFFPYPATVRNCGAFFVYRLSSTQACNIGYCVEMDIPECSQGWLFDTVLRRCVVPQADLEKPLITVVVDDKDGAFLKCSWKLPIHVLTLDPVVTWYLIVRGGFKALSQNSTLKIGSDVFAGSTVVCGMKSSSNVGSASKDSTDYSEPFFLGLKVRESNVTVRANAQPVNVTIYSTIPVYCASSIPHSECMLGVSLLAFGQDGEPNPRVRFSTCYVEFKAADCIAGVCSEHVVQVTCYPYVTPISSAEDEVITLVGAINDLGQGLWRQEVVDVEIKLQHIPLAQCHVFTDPHIITFDGKLYDLDSVGTFLLHKSLSRDFTVHVRVSDCGARKGVCACGFVARDMGDVVSIDMCHRQLPPGKADVSFPGNFLTDDVKVFETNGGKVLTILFSSGTLIKTVLEAWGMSISLLAPPADDGLSRGLCGLIVQETDDSTLDAGNDGVKSGSRGQSTRSLIEIWRLPPGRSFFDEPPTDSQISLNAAPLCHCSSADSASGSVCPFTPLLDNVVPSVLPAEDRTNFFFTLSRFQSASGDGYLPDPLVSDTKAGNFEATGIEYSIIDNDVAGAGKRDRLQAAPPAAEDQTLQRMQTYFFRYDKAEEAAAFGAGKPAHCNVTDVEAANICAETLLRSDVALHCAEHLGKLLETVLEICKADIQAKNDRSWAEAAIFLLVTLCDLNLLQSARQFSPTAGSKPEWPVALANALACPKGCRTGNCASTGCRCAPGFSGLDCGISVEQMPLDSKRATATTVNVTSDLGDTTAYSVLPTPATATTTLNTEGLSKVYQTAASVTSDTDSSEATTSQTTTTAGTPWPLDTTSKTITDSSLDTTEEQTSSPTTLKTITELSSDTTDKPQSSPTTSKTITDVSSDTTDKPLSSPTTLKTTTDLSSDTTDKPQSSYTTSKTITGLSSDTTEKAITDSSPTTVEPPGTSAFLSTFLAAVETSMEELSFSTATASVFTQTALDVSSTTTATTATATEYSASPFSKSFALETTHGSVADSLLTTAPKAASLATDDLMIATTIADERPKTTDSDVQLRHDDRFQLCDVNSQRCTDVVFDIFPDVQRLRCRVSAVAVADGQVMPIPTSQPVATASTYGPDGRFTCILPYMDFLRQAFNTRVTFDSVQVEVVAVSGEVKSTVVYTTYDSLCRTCGDDGRGGCHTKPDTCYIEGKCYQRHQPQPFSACLQCRPDVIKDDWSTRANNLKPVISFEDRPVVFLGQNVHVRVWAVDPDGSGLILSVDRKDAYISQAGLFQWRSNANGKQDIGRETFLITARDECNGTASSALEILTIPCECENGATCTNPAVVGSEAKYDCICAPGYTGDRCDSDIDECSSEPCVHGSCVDLVNGFNCLCDVGFEGERCEENVSDQCHNEPCFPGVLCQPAGGSFVCGPCPAGYVGDGQTCEEFDACESSPCFPGVHCKDLAPPSEGFDCDACPRFFAGDGQQCHRTTASACLASVCSEHVTCQELKEFPGYRCGPCPYGYKGDGSVCEPICDGGCPRGRLCVRPWLCGCRPGYTGDTCHIPVCYPLCRNGGMCIAPNKCRCAPGYTGPHCQETTCSPPCVNDGRCIGRNRCLCRHGYLGNRCELQACQMPCQNDGVCVGPNRCRCQPGFHGQYCQQATCHPACQNGGLCITPGRCQCPSGYEGRQCERAICNPLCQNGGICKRFNTCKCAPGYDGHRCQIAICLPACVNGGRCVAPNACSCHSGWGGNLCDRSLCSLPCRNGGVCFKPEICVCRRGYGGSDCSQPLCWPHCQHGGWCLAPNVCHCRRGFAGKHCELPLS